MWDANRLQCKKPSIYRGLWDWVASGIVSRLDRPGGNVTGFAVFETTLGGKWLELLSEIAPGLKRAALMFDVVTTIGLYALI